MVSKKGLLILSFSFFKIMLIPVSVIGFSIFVSLVGIGLFQTDAIALATDHKSNSKIYGCTNYGDIIHCDPMLNILNSYVMRGHSSIVYIPNGTVIFATGKYEKALELHASRLETVEVNNTKSISPEKFSVSFWIKRLTGYTGTIISHSNYTNTAGWYIRMFENGNVSFCVTGSSGHATCTPGISVPPDKFTHIGAIFDGSTVRIYKNGEPGAELRFAGKYDSDPATPLRIGGVAGSGGESLWSGIIDDLGIYNRALSQNEVKAIFNSNTPLPVSYGLVSHWTFDNNLTDTASFSYHNNGILRTLIASMVFSPDGRLFFSEKNTGNVMILKNSKVLDRPFAKISDLYVDVEQGLLGLAIDPLYEQNHFVYVYYTAIDNNKVLNRLVRYTDVNNTGKDMSVILDNIPAVRGYHSGGGIAFGPDGKLYLGVGDATNSIFAQNPSVPLGKVLRINRDGSIPHDNPFPNSPVFTLGHRNVYGVAFDKEHGIGIIAENGDAFYDEINLIRKGGNYGFPTFQPPNFAPKLTNASLSILPLRSYWRTPAPTQTIFYEGEKFLDLKDRFLFGAFDGNIYALTFDKKNTKIIQDEKIALRLYPYSPVTSLAQSPNGDIYFAGNAIYKLVSVDSSNKHQILFPIVFNSSTPINILRVQAFLNASGLVIDFQTTNNSKTKPLSPLFLSIKIPEGLVNRVTALTMNNTIVEPLDISINNSTSVDTVRINYAPATIYHLVLTAGEKYAAPFKNAFPGYLP